MVMFRDFVLKESPILTHSWRRIGRDLCICDSMQGPVEHARDVFLDMIFSQF